jgi:hypothetical protein
VAGGNGGVDPGRALNRHHVREFNPDRKDATLGGPAMFARIGVMRARIGEGESWRGIDDPRDGPTSPCMDDTSGLAARGLMSHKRGLWTQRATIAIASET